MRKSTARHWIAAGLLAVGLAAPPAQARVAPDADPVAYKGSAKPVAYKVAAKSARTSVKTQRGVAGRRVVVRKVVVRVVAAAPSFGHLSGLQRTNDALDLKSSVAYVIDQDTNEVLLAKNSQAVLPIASITKLMTALVVTEAALPLDEVLTVTQEDVDATSASSSRLRLGTRLSRGEMLHLALMSSENRAAHVLGRTYPGGIDTFVGTMNAKARALGMNDTQYVEPTGLSSSNQSSAPDLTRLVKAASRYPLIRELSTSPEAMVPVGSRQLQFHNTNALVRSAEWDIGLQKTGYIAAAGRCLVMQAQLAGRKLIMVLLDSAGKYSRIGDAERIRKWLAVTPGLGGSGNTAALAGAAAVQPR